MTEPCAQPAVAEDSVVEVKPMADGVVASTSPAQLIAASEAVEPAPTRVRRSRSVLDPAWLFLLAGVALLGATVLVSAQAQVDDAAYVRDRALAVEDHREQRISRYREFLVGVETKQPALVEALASSQLNQIPASRAAIPGTVRDNLANASVFPALEPPPFTEPPKTKIQSRLAQLTSNDATRVWLLAGASVLILVGLLPASRR
ncbi:MAG: hypothetical protein U0640_09105 [Phycisphaerales bacterium]